MPGKGWLEEGFFVRLKDPVTQARNFWFVDEAHAARIQFNWPRTVAVNTEDGPENVEDLKPLNLKHLFQVTMGVRTGALIYINLPQATRLGGFPKRPSATSANRFVGWWDHNLTPFESPTFGTEFFLMKGGDFEFPALVAFNPTDHALVPEIKFEARKLVISEVTEPETLTKLERRQIPFRPVVFGPLEPTRTGPG